MFLLHPTWWAKRNLLAAAHRSRTWLRLNVAPIEATVLHGVKKHMQLTCSVGRGCANLQDMLAGEILRVSSLLTGELFDVRICMHTSPSVHVHACTPAN